MRHWYILWAKIEFLFDFIYFISRAIQAWKNAERCSSLPLFFHDRCISRQFLPHLHHVLSYRKKLSFFSRARNYFFTTVVFAIDDWPVSAKSVYQFPRVLCASLRCITVTISRVFEAIEKIDERCDELGGVSCLARKSETKPIDPPSMMMAVALVVAHRVFRRRVPAVFLALFNNCALSFWTRYHAFLLAAFIRKRFLSDRVDETFVISGK